MKSKKSEKFWKILFPILGACIIITSVSILLYRLGLLDFLYPSVSMEKWPAYDESYRLDTGGEKPTDEAIAYYIATKIPDAHKEGLEKISITKKYEAVELAPAPGYEDKEQGPNSIYTAPFTGSMVVSEGFAFEVTLKYREKTLVCSITNLMPLLEAGSDCYFSRIQLEHNGRSTSISSTYPSIKQYKHYFPDYVIQPET